MFYRGGFSGEKFVEKLKVKISASALAEEVRWPPLVCVFVCGCGASWGWTDPHLFGEGGKEVVQ